MRTGDISFGRGAQHAEQNLTFYPSLSGTIICTLMFAGFVALGLTLVNSPSIPLLADNRRLAFLIEVGIIPFLGWLMVTISSYIIVVHLWAIVSRRPSLELSRTGLICNSFFDRRTRIPWSDISDVRSNEQSRSLAIHLREPELYRNRMSLWSQFFAWFFSPDKAIFTISPLELGDDAETVLDAIKRYRPVRATSGSVRKSRR